MRFQRIGMMRKNALFRTIVQYYLRIVLLNGMFSGSQGCGVASTFTDSESDFDSDSDSELNDFSEIDYSHQCINLFCNQN